MRRARLVVEIKPRAHKPQIEGVHIAQGSRQCCSIAVLNPNFALREKATSGTKKGATGKSKIKGRRKARIQKAWKEFYDCQEGQIGKDRDLSCSCSVSGL